MPRLLIVTTVDSTLQRFLLPYAGHFRNQGWTVDALASGAASSRACREGFDRCHEAAWSRNPFGLQGLLRMPGNLRRLVQREDYDLVHVHTPVAAFLTRYTLRRLRLQGRPKVVYTAHGFHFHDGRPAWANQAFAALERTAGPWTDRLVVINDADHQEALRRRIIDPARIRPMPGIGLDLAQYDPARVPQAAVADLRASLGIAPGQPMFLMAAAFDPGKRHRDLLAAFAGLENLEAHLVFAGDGPLLAPLQAWARDRGLAGRVHFLGYRDDVPVLMRAALATVLPSEREGLPRCVMESMAMGVPVIGADARGTRDLLAECGGVLVPVGDPGALQNALLEMIRNPERARSLGQQARTRVGRFHIAHLLRMHE
jgi:glycosyltransferase involved in cell wall biosynthesis